MEGIDRAVNAEAMGLRIAKQRECLHPASMATLILDFPAGNPSRIGSFLGLPIRCRESIPVGTAQLNTP